MLFRSVEYDDRGMAGGIGRAGVSRAAACPGIARQASSVGAGAWKQLAGRKAGGALGEGRPWRAAGWAPVGGGSAVSSAETPWRRIERAVRSQSGNRGGKPIRGRRKIGSEGAGKRLTETETADRGTAGSTDS